MSLAGPGQADWGAFWGGCPPKDRQGPGCPHPCEEQGVRNFGLVCNEHRFLEAV